MTIINNVVLHNRNGMLIIYMMIRMNFFSFILGCHIQVSGCIWDT